MDGNLLGIFRGILIVAKYSEAPGKHKVICILGKGKYFLEKTTYYTL